MRIIAITPKGEKLEYRSMREAARDLGCAHSNIAQYFKGKRKTVCGCTFEITNEPTDKRGRKKRDGNMFDQWTRKKDKLVYLYPENKQKEFEKKQAFYYEDKQIMQVFYNRYDYAPANLTLDIDKMQRKLKRRIEDMFGKCIVIFNTFSSHHHKGEYIYTEITLRALEPPTSITMTHIENLIIDTLVFKPKERKRY